MGSIYAARLQESGQTVSILARGERLKDIREHGLVLLEAPAARTTVTPVTVVEQLAPSKAYDLAVVAMGKHQVAAVLPALAVNPLIPTILILQDNASGPAAMIKALGRSRVMFGFAGVGGGAKALAFITS